MRTTLVLVALSGSVASAQLLFVDATDELGLGGQPGPHCCFVDLNNDGRPDAVIGRNRVFLNTPDADAEHGLKFVEVENNGLPAFRNQDISVFADLDNDGIKDCVWTRYLDINNEKYEAPTEGPPKTAWFKGNGDGTFGQPVGTWQVIEAAKEATTAAIAVGDVDRDGCLDLYLGNWYTKYGEGLEAFTNQLLLGFSRPGGDFVDAPRLLPDFGKEFDEEHDEAGRPTYGVMMVELDPRPAGEVDRRTTNVWEQLLDLNYGRRWNRLMYADQPLDRFEATKSLPSFRDLAPALGLDGDAERVGEYPEWIKERAKDDPRFYREDEKPFRANGNTFDASIGDIDNDGDFDLFFAEIAHGWAGLSSDRSRFLVREVDADGTVRFVYKPELSVDRMPADGSVRSWNQGDIFAQLADFDLDGRLDLLLCSSDYPDNQRLRIYRQQTDGTFDDITSWVGIDHIGALQPSLADIDGDGDLDIIVGQSFNRLRADQREGRTPRVRVYLNQAADKHLGNALVLRLVGDEQRGVSRDALGTIVRVTAEIGGEQVTQARQIVGIGGHEGKQMDFVAHFGLGDATEASRMEIEWPSAARQVTTLEHVQAGTHTVRLAESEGSE